MLETRSGSLYLSNNGTTTMAIQAGADPNAMVSQGVVACLLYTSDAADE